MKQESNDNPYRNTANLLHIQKCGRFADQQKQSVWCYFLILEYILVFKKIVSQAAIGKYLILLTLKQ